VRALAPAVVGLKGSFHFSSSRAAVCGRVARSL
jgi:hypothetical protein